MDYRNLPAGADHLSVLQIILDRLSAIELRLAEVVICIRDGGIPVRTTRNSQPEPGRTPIREEDDGEQLDRAIIDVLAESPVRLTTEQIFAALDRRRAVYSETTVKRHLANMVRVGAIANDRNARPPGYSLP